MSPSITCPSCGGGSVTRMAGSEYACANCLTLFTPDTSTLSVPDHIGEVVGYRAWHIVETSEGTRLASTGYGGKYSRQVWIPGEVNEALCHKGTHAPPSETCTCGFYAAKTRDHLLSLNRYHLYDPDNPEKIAVIGQVAMDGRVIPATLGWRAQFAWPMNILVPHEFWKLVAPLREAYGPWGVEVDLDNTLVMPKADGPKWCKKCGVKLTPRAAKCDTCGALAGD